MRLTSVTMPIGLMLVVATTATTLLVGWPTALVLQTAPLVMIAALTALELWAGRWKPSRRNAVRDLVCNLLGSTAGAVAPAVVTAALLGVSGEGRGPLATLPFAASLIAALLASDLAGYVMHRLFHAVPVLWRAHALHHQPHELYVLVSGVDNPLFVFAIRSLRAGVLVLLGCPADVLFAVAMFDFWQGLSSHLGLDTHNPWLSMVLVTPQTHRLHHRDGTERHGNYAVLFTLWDRVFGTFIAPTGDVPTLGSGDATTSWFRTLLMRRG